jgi:hypothetical protein
MGFRVYKRIRLSKGVSLNLSRSGINTSFGVKGFRYSVGSSSRSRSSASGGGCLGILLLGGIIWAVLNAQWILWLCGLAVVGYFGLRAAGVLAAASKPDAGSIWSEAVTLQGKAVGGVFTEIDRQHLLGLRAQAQQVDSVDRGSMANLYRVLGETFEQVDMPPYAVEMYQLAISYNPRVGVQRRLNAILDNPRPAPPSPQ